MVQRTQISSTADKRYRQDINRELAKFEEREKKFIARVRRERAAELGLPLRGLREETATSLSRSKDTVA